jgi:uncharacterized protein YkwD
MGKKATVVVFATAALLSIFASQASACSGANGQPGRLSIADSQVAITCLINKQRARHHLHPVSANILLGSAAAEHSGAMASENFFSHEGDDGTPASRAANAGYMAGARAWGIGENLEWATAGAATPRHVVRSWMKSAEHRSVILTRNFRQVGIGIADGSPVAGIDQNAETFTAVFGFRKG